MFKEVVDQFGVPTSFWRDLAGCSELMLKDWLTGRRTVPRSTAKQFSQATGVPPELFLRKESAVDFNLPKLWLRARNAGISQQGRGLQTISYARLLAEKYWEVLQILDKTGDTDPSDLFIRIQATAFQHASPDEQGRSAASVFLHSTNLNHQQVGIGEILRGYMRANGIFVFETPLRAADLEGFCMEVGQSTGKKPCIFANTYATTWFHRNFVLLHELCHAIFDIQEMEAEFDGSLSDEPPSENGDHSENRANSFAMNALVSKDLLDAYSNRGFQISELDSKKMAQLMAETHAEPKLIIKAALSYGLISEDASERLRQNVPSQTERAMASYHAKQFDQLSPEEMSSIIREPQAVNEWPRNTAFPMRGMRLPLPFVNHVLEALESHKISSGKAKELLMTRDLSRFGVAVESV